MDSSYNCVAWAAGVTTVPWWPFEWPYYWPQNVPLEESITAFVAAFATLRYVECDQPDLEDGIEKRAIYADAQQVPTHVARQLADGRWTSKLGDLKDIEHATLADLAGGLYGTPATFMKRLVAGGSDNRTRPMRQGSD
ncbi:MAG: hypothetical protein EXR51_05655 [Dehalococcoidia bacterium]|nr:hypothetical protein [Dehalococcoidia bacterium]